MQTHTFGTNSKWIPGEKTSGGCNEAVLDNMVITHNNDIEKLFFNKRIQMKMIEDAIEKGELHLFLMGEGGYKCQGRSDYPDPTDYLACWEEDIIPYFNKNNSLESVMLLYDSIIMLFDYPTDINLGLYSITSHIEWCYYFEEEKMLRFHLDWKTIAEKLKLAVEINKERLVADTRWAGAEWNSCQGLYEPICRVLTKLLA